MYPSLFAEAVMVTNVMKSYVTPTMVTLTGIATLVSTFFLIVGGFHYITSSGDPVKLENAKRVLKNALIGLALVLGAAVVTAILSNAYSTPPETITEQLPTLQALQADEATEPGILNVVVGSVIKLLRNFIEAAAQPFLTAINFFLNSTPLMAQNSNVFNLWLAVAGIANTLFVIVVAILGFQVMSFSTFGFEELDIRQLIPRLGLGFVLINSSIFMIDALIGLSNAMIYALQSGFQTTDIWAVMVSISEKSAGMNIAGLMILVAFLVLTVMLLIYYLMRLVTLYVGAIMSPLVMLLWLLPTFRDFAITAVKAYLTTVFILFVHVVIVLLAASILTGIETGTDTAGQPNVLMGLLVGVATIMSLLKTQGALQQVATVASVPRAAREVTGSFFQSVSQTKRSAQFSYNTAKLPYKGGKKLHGWYTNRKNPERENENPGGGNDNNNASNSKPSSARSTPATNHKRSLKTGETVKATPKKKGKK